MSRIGQNVAWLMNPIIRARHCATSIRPIEKDLCAFRFVEGQPELFVDWRGMHSFTNPYMAMRTDHWFAQCQHVTSQNYPILQIYGDRERMERDMVILRIVTPKRAEDFR